MLPADGVASNKIPFGMLLHSGWSKTTVGGYGDSQDENSVFLVLSPSIHLLVAPISIFQIFPLDGSVSTMSLG